MTGALTLFNLLKTPMPELKKMDHLMQESLLDGITKPEFLAYEDELGRFHTYEKYRKLDGLIGFNYKGFLINKEALEQQINWYTSRPYWKTIRYCPDKTIRDRDKTIQCQSWLFTPNEDYSESTPVWKFVDSIPLKLKPTKIKMNGIAKYLWPELAKDGEVCMTINCVIYDDD